MLTAGVFVAALGVLAATGAASWRSVVGHAGVAALLLVLTLALQAAAVRLPGGFAVSFASTGILASGFVSGVGAAAAAGMVVAGARFVLARGRPSRAVFDAGNLALAAAAGTSVDAAIDSSARSPLGHVVAALAAAVLFYLVNTGLLALAMSTAEDAPLLRVWRLRFLALAPYAVAAAPLGLGLALAYGELGAIGPVLVAVAALVPVALIRATRARFARPFAGGPATDPS
jgi:hypothetical protein